MARKIDRCGSNMESENRLDVYTFWVVSGVWEFRNGNGKEIGGWSKISGRQALRGVI